MSEISATLQWLDTALANAGATGIYHGAAPPAAATPYITVTLYGPSDVMGVAGARLWANNTWLIEAWGPDDTFASVASVVAAIDTALHQKSSIGVADGVIVSSTREQARMAFAEVGDQQWVRMGGVYRIEARQN